MRDPTSDATKPQGCTCTIGTELGHALDAEELHCEVEQGEETNAAPGKTSMTMYEKKHSFRKKITCRIKDPT